MKDYEPPKLTEITPKHTPGPWRTGTRERGRFCVYSEEHGRGICVMSNTQKVTPEQTAKYGEHGDNLTADANARLIAAAPELLQCLITLVKMVEDGDLTTTELNEARAAILKALEGK